MRPSLPCCSFGMSSLKIFSIPYESSMCLTIILSKRRSVSGRKGWPKLFKVSALERLILQHVGVITNHLIVRLEEPFAEPL